MKVIINGVEAEGMPGERLLNVARRTGAHIGFVCDGNGTCTTCECQVRFGTHFLSPPNETERAWLPRWRLEQGYRLACQAGIRGRGPIEIETRAEQLRRLTLRSLGGRDADARDRARDDLVDMLGDLAWEHLSRYPANILQAFGRLGLRMFLPIGDTQKYLDDVARVSDTMAGERPLAPASGQATQRRAAAEVDARVAGSPTAADEYELRRAAADVDARVQGAAPFSAPDLPPAPSAGEVPFTAPEAPKPLTAPNLPPRPGE
jgi:ferredoxin